MNAIQSIVSVCFGVIVHAHKGVGLSKRFGDGREVSVPAGGKWTGDLPGDYVGMVKDELSHQRRMTPMAEDMFGGHVEVKDPEYSDEPPVGSKKWLALVESGEIKPKKKEVATLDADAKAAIGVTEEEKDEKPAKKKSDK